jgi:hypothetical protein
MSKLREAQAAVVLARAPKGSVAYEEALHNFTAEVYSPTETVIHTATTLSAHAAVELMTLRLRELEAANDLLRDQLLEARANGERWEIVAAARDVQLLYAERAIGATTKG